MVSCRELCRAFLCTTIKCALSVCYYCAAYNVYTLRSKYWLLLRTSYSSSVKAPWDVSLSRERGYVHLGLHRLHTLSVMFLFPTVILQTTNYYSLQFYSPTSSIPVYHHYTQLYSAACCPSALYSALSYLVSK